MREVVVAVRRERGLVDARHDVGVAVEIGQRNLGFVAHLLDLPVLVTRGGAAPHRDIATDRLDDRGLGGGAVARQPAIGPLDAAVAERHAGLGEHDQPALEAGEPRDLLEPLVRDLVDRLRDAHHDVRRRDQLAEAGARQRLDLGERLGGDQLGRKLARDRDRDLDGLGFEPRLDRLQALRQRRDALRDALAGVRRARLRSWPRRPRQPVR